MLEKRSFCGYGRYFNGHYYNNICEPHWIVVITIIGWISLVKGFMFLAFPNALKIFEPMFTGKFLKVFPYFTLAFGLLFGYFGFIA